MTNPKGRKPLNANQELEQRNIWFIDFQRRFCVRHGFREVCLLCGSPIYVRAAEVGRGGTGSPLNLTRACDSCLALPGPLPDTRTRLFKRELKAAVSKAFIKTQSGYVRVASMRRPGYNARNRRG